MGRKDSIFTQKFDKEAKDLVNYLCKRVRDPYEQKIILEFILEIVYKNLEKEICEGLDEVDNIIDELKNGKDHPPGLG